VIEHTTQASTREDILFSLHSACHNGVSVLDEACDWMMSQDTVLADALGQPGGRAKWAHGCHEIGLCARADLTAADADGGAGGAWARATAKKQRKSAAKTAAKDGGEAPPPPEPEPMADAVEGVAGARGAGGLGGSSGGLGGLLGGAAGGGSGGLASLGGALGFGK